METTTTSPFRLGTPLTRDKLNYYKSLTPIYRGDDLIAFVGMETGWKKDWIVYPITPRVRDHDCIDGYGPDASKENFRARAVTIYQYGREGNGREAACSRLEEVFESTSFIRRHAEFFRSASEQIADITARKALEARNKEMRLAAKRKAITDLETRIAGLRSIQKLNILDLDQRNALANTVTLLEDELDFNKRHIDDI